MRTEHFEITTNLENIDALNKKLNGKNNFQAYQACNVYAYFKSQKDEKLPTQRIKLSVGSITRGGHSEKEFLNNDFDIVSCAYEGLKGYKVNFEDIECVLFHFGKEL